MLWAIAAAPGWPASWRGFRFKGTAKRVLGREDRDDLTLAATVDVAGLEPDTGRQSTRKRRCLPWPSLDKAQWRGVFFLVFIFGMAALTATVLREPIEEAAIWMREEGLKGYFILGALGFVLVMIGASSTVFDVVCGYVYGLEGGFILSLTVKFLATLIGFIIAKHVLKDYMREHFVEKYVYLEALADLVQEKPWMSVVIIRLTALPTAVKNYSLGAFDAKYAPYICTSIVTLAAASYVLTDLGSKISSPSKLFSTKSENSRILEYVGIAACLLAFAWAIYYGRKYAKRAIARKADARREANSVATSPDDDVTTDGSNHGTMGGEYGAVEEGKGRRKSSLSP